MGKRQQQSLPTKKKKGISVNDDANDDDDEVLLLLERMAIAQSVLSNDTTSMAEILKSCLSMASDVQNVRITKSVGESFTGGRSTPVYWIRADVCRRQRTKKKKNHHDDDDTVVITKNERQFVVKLVLMPMETDDSRNYIQQQKRESYAVERRFYNVVAERVRNHHLTIPRLLASDLDGSRPWANFCILMNDVSVKFPCHPDFMSVAQAKRALDWIAKFHALFYRDPTGATTWRRDLWSRGAFWTKSSNYDGIAATWVSTMRFLEHKHPEYITSTTKSIGQRIQTAGKAIASFLTSQTSTHGTLIHGDYKAANLFFSEENADDGSDSVAAVDFQFAGLGLGAEDVAYMLYPDARGDFFQNEHELLQGYHEEFVSQLILQQKGGPSTLPFGVFLRHYDLARLDMTRHWLAKGWIASTAGEAKLVSILEKSLDQLDGGNLHSTLNNHEPSRRL